MIIYVMRHGETSWNKGRRLQGRHGADLDEEGVLLAEVTRDGMKDIPFDICFTSPLIRARHTAEIVIGDRDIPIVEEPRIMEIGFGVWEGKSCDLNHLEISREDYLAVHDDPFGYRPPEGGETISQVVDRCQDFFRELISREDLKDKTVLVSTHGCASRAFLNSVVDDPSDFWQGHVPMNCAVSRIDVVNGHAELTMFDHVYYGKEYYHNYYEQQRESEAKQIPADEKAEARTESGAEE